MNTVKNVKALNTTNWQHKRNTIGGVVTDLDDIEQCYETICNVQKGSVVHNPNLGWNILKYIDRPITQVRTQIQKDLLTELNYQEPRATVSSVKVLEKTADETIKKVAKGNFTIYITYTPIDSNISLTKEVSVWQMK